MRAGAFSRRAATSQVPGRTSHTSRIPAGYVAWGSRTPADSGTTAVTILASRNGSCNTIVPAAHTMLAPTLVTAAVLIPASVNA